MITVNTQSLAAALPYLAVLAPLATNGIYQKGDKLRFRMSALTASKSVRDAVRDLALVGAREVRILEGDRIHTYEADAEDGEVTHTGAPSRKDRSKTGVVVEVTL